MFWFKISSPGLMVMGGDSCPRGREFESQDTSKLIVFKICLLDKTKNKRKEVGYGPFKKMSNLLLVETMSI